MEQTSLPQTSWYMAVIQGTTAVPKAIAKLIGTVGDQIGMFLEPTHIRRKGQAEADVLVSEAKAKAEIAVLKVENKLAIQLRQDRAAERTRKREEKRQANLEAITAEAAQAMPEEASEVPVDEDWVAQFFNHCEDVSNEQMRSLWARLLAGEVAKPGSFSLRTLAAVRVMSKQDANMFTRFCSMLWQTPNGLTAVVPSIEKLASYGIDLGFVDFVRLAALGLIRLEGVGNFSLSFTAVPILLWQYYGRPHRISNNDARMIETGKAFLTDIGQELAIVAGSSPNEEYRSWVVTTFRGIGWEVLES